jgi:hypothetical protein
VELSRGERTPTARGDFVLDSLFLGSLLGNRKIQIFALLWQRLQQDKGEKLKLIGEGERRRKA